MDYKLMGYLFVHPERTAEWVLPTLPISVCSMMYNVLPDGDFWDWAASNKSSAVCAENLGMSEQLLNDIREYCEPLHPGSMDFNVIHERAVADHLYRMLHPHLPGYRLLAYYAHPEDAVRCVGDATLATGANHFDGVLLKDIYETAQTDENTLGYETVCTVDGMGLCSPYCYNQTPEDLTSVPGLTRNGHGLLRSEAVRKAALSAANGIRDDFDCFFCKIKEVPALHS